MRPTFIRIERATVAHFSNTRKVTYRGKPNTLTGPKTLDWQSSVYISIDSEHPTRRCRCQLYLQRLNEDLLR